MNKRVLSTFIATVMIFTSISSGRVFANSIENSNKKMASAKEMTNVYKVWNDYKYKGEGMVISVIDSGIDYTHKDMKITDTSKMKIKDKIVSGKGKYFSDKVPYGYNFADDNENIIDTESMHGMHVAGIVAANGDEKDVKAENAMQGVAPEAQLFAMKVFANDSDFPSCNNEDVVEAIDASVEHGADVINMSLGSNGACVELDEPSAIAIRNAQQKGVLVVTAAGNSQYSTAPGKYKDIVDTGIIDSPSIYNEAFSVASIENKAIMVQALEYKTPKEQGEIAYCLSEINPLGVLKGDYELVECGLGKISDFKGKNLKGKIALVKRGSNGFLEKKINAQKSGAVGIIVYNEDDKKGHEYMNEEEQVNIPAISITNEDGNKLKKLIASKVKIKFVDKYKSIENPDKVTMSSFSSWGPASNLEMKPEITAPGGEIWSTLNNNKYGIKSGTSMATPHVAGAMALLLQHMKTLDFGNITPNEKMEMVKTIAMNTAKVQIDPETEDKKIPFSPRRQGAGLIDINAALNNNVIVTDSRGKGNIALKDFSEQSKTFSLKLKNFGKKDAVYTVKDLSGVLTEQTEDIKSISYDVLLDGAKITFDKNEIVVPAGKEVNVNVTLNLSKDTPKNIFIEGFITFEAKTSDIESIGIPYMGFYGAWDELSIIDKAAWEKESKLKKTGLYKINQEGKLDMLGVSNKNEGLNVDIEEDTIAMTTGNGKAIVVPKLALLRNVNNIYVDLLDANNNVIRNIGADSNLSKYVWAPEDLESADNDNYEKSYPWAWDLTTYNKSTGHYEIVKDGQYYIQVKCNVDYPNAKYQNIKMPIKIDSVKPELKISLQKGSVLSKKYKLKYKVTDDFSGISNVYIDINDNPYLKEGNEKIAYKPNANGECNVDLELLKGNNNIKVYAVDNAGNVSVDEIDVELDDIVITSYEDGQAVDGENLKLAYNVTKELKAKAKYFSVYVDDKEVGKGNKDMSYNIKELSAGVHDISVIAYDKNKKKLASADSWVFVKFKELYINFVGVKREGSFYNDRNVNLKGNLTTGTKVFTIQGKNVNLENDLTFKTDIELKDGLNKVKVYAEDNNNNKFDYALNLYCDLTSPEINITSNNGGERCTLQCEVKDNNPFYKLYVNGNEIKSIDSNWSKCSKYLTDVNLEKGNNIIEVKAIDVAGNSIVKNISIVK